jgi:hypothetical protein
MGRGVPQYLFREMFQSRAFANQFWNRFSPTAAGTLGYEIAHEVFANQHPIIYKKKRKADKKN